MPTRMAEKDSLSFILNHLAEEREGYRGAVTPPIYETSNFAFGSVAAMRAAGQDELANAQSMLDAENIYFN